MWAYKEKGEWGISKKGYKKEEIRDLEERNHIKKMHEKKKTKTKIIE